MVVPPARIATAAGQGNSKGAIGSVGTVKGPCYNCNQPGHFSKFCPYPPRKKQHTYNARVHHTTVDEISKGEPMTAGKFPVNQNPVVVLFDSGSSYSFMSQAFARKHEQLCTDLSYGYRISSAWADVLTNQMVRGATLEFGSRKFQVNLIVMPGLVLDVIIGMNWMKKWGAVIDTRSRVLTLKDS
jgi:predicted aspartyl protease